jgi:uncharacterized protein (TIGR03032 family)
MKARLHNWKLEEKADHKWRDPLQLINFEGCFNRISPQLLKYKVYGDWWEIINRLNIRLLVSREHEHILMCLGCESDSPEISFLALPHPSGIAVDQDKRVIYVASTRNPNMIYQFNPIQGFIERKDKNKFREISTAVKNTLVPGKVFFLPGSLYIHDMIFMNRKLYANAVGHNSIIQISEDGGYKYVWWPKCIEKENKPDISDNYLQLNSIAAGKTINNSYFTSSTEKILSTRPGDINFPVNKKGVLFYGKTKEVVCRGLTRPHSARMNEGKVWLNNSGYGEIGFVEKNKFNSFLKLPGWTRGLYFKDDIAFVGTSRVNTRFSNYAPGVDLKSDICAIHAIDIKKCKIIGSIDWPFGSQIFAVEGIDKNYFGGLPMNLLQRKTPENLNHLFYAFKNNRV